MSDTVRDPLDLLAEEYLDRRRRGESPTIEEYAAAHPDLATQVRELFPTLEMMEDLASGADGADVRG